MKALKLCLAVSIALLIVLAGCTPKSLPVSSPSSPTPSAPAAASSSLVTSTITQKTPWEKTVEAAQKEGQLTFYSVSVFNGDAGLAMAKAFKDRYGITVDILQGRGADWMERLKVERRMGQQVGDMVYGSTAHLANMKKEGLLEALLDLPMLQEKGIWNADPLGLDPEAYLISFYLNTYAPAVNTKLVKPDEEPKSFSDLLLPKWKDKKIAIADPRISSLFYLHFVTLVNNKALDWNFIKLLYKQNPMVYRGGGDLDTALARGDFPIAITQADVRTASLLAEGATVKQISMKEGDTRSLNSLVKVKGSPHPNATRVFINWMLSEEGQDLFSKTHGLLGINSRARDWRHPTLHVKSTKLFPTSIKDAEDQGRLFEEGFINKLVAEDK